MALQRIFPLFLPPARKIDRGEFRGESFRESASRVRVGRLAVGLAVWVGSAPVAWAAPRSMGLGGGTYNANNGFTNGANYDIHSASLVVRHKFATGANEAPSVTHPVTNKRHAIVDLVMPTK